MTFLPTDTGINLFESPMLLVGILLVLTIGITLVVLAVKEIANGVLGGIGVVAVIGAFIIFIIYLSSMGLGASKQNEANLSANLKQKYNIETLLSVEDVRYKDHDRVEVTVHGVSHKLWLGQDKGSYEPVLFSGDGESNLDIKTIEKNR